MSRFVRFCCVPLLSGCGPVALHELPLDENVSQGFDDLPALVCSEPLVTSDGEAEASSIICEPAPAPVPSS